MNEFLIMAPCALVRSNDHRDAYWTRAKLTQQWRERAQLIAQDAPELGAGPFHVTATLHRADNRAFDLDGHAATVKACIDGLRDAGVIVDDNSRHIPALTLRAGEKRDRACVVIRIEAHT